MKIQATHSIFGLSLSLLLIQLAGCDPREFAIEANESKTVFEVVAILESKKLDEVSGIQSGEGGVFFMHNDEGSPSIYVAGLDGRHLGKLRIRGAKNRDWEDITRIPGKNGPLLVLGDTGDNHARYQSIKLYVVEEPSPSENGSYEGNLDLLHELIVRYPDGPRDCESMAYDPVSKMILFMTKRDHPSRLYGLTVEEALNSDKAELQYLGDVHGFRPPTNTDLLTSKKRGRWISQPTGMDISSDGMHAAVITYRSLYLFEREEGETWPEAFLKSPIEHVGPPGLHDEAVSYGFNTLDVYVSTERRPTPVYQLVVPDKPGSGS
jgi:hypothetical protein